MLFRKNIVSTRTLLQLTVAMVFIVGGVGAAFAANSGVAPLLVPYTINTIAGTPQFPNNTAILPAAGFGGEGGPATPFPVLNSSGQVQSVVPGATLNAPYDMTIDSVGNVYITDTGNDIIREVNAQTGLITTVGGVIPKGCSGVACTVRSPGCADGVPAVGNPIAEKMQGIAVDAYGNIYFDDSTTQTVSVIYRAGTQVANFIKLENPTGVAASGGQVLPGYVYHVAGTYNAATCSGTSGAADNVLALQGQLKGPEILSLDSAGNIYIGDTGNATVRVINTQATPQTFFQYTVPPGFIRSITNCSPTFNTGPCPTGAVSPQGTNPQLNTGINGPVNAIVYSSQYKNATVDAYGNLYQLNGTGSGTGPPGIYSATTYAGGPGLTNLLTVEAPMLAGYYGPSIGNAPAELPLTYGNSYISAANPSLNSGSLPSGFPDVLSVTNENFVIRPTSLRPDIFGTLWSMDTHYSELSRIDQYTSLGTEMIRGGTTGNSRNAVSIPPINPLPASFTNPYFCVYGNVGSNLPWKQGPQTYDPQGDGCPSIVAFQGGNTTSGPDVNSDGLGNLYLADDTNQIMREFPLGNVFPATAVGTTAPVTQPIQVHFTYPNVPVTSAVPIPDGAMTGYTTTGFSIAPGIPDFTINSTTPEFPMGILINSGDTAYNNTTTTSNFQMWAGLPTCTQLGVAPTAVSPADLDYDCLVYVTFNPTAPGVRKSQLVATTKNNSVYYFSLTGIGLGGQLAIDGGQAQPVAATGLGKPAAVAVNSAGTIYIADPDNNRIVVTPAGGGTQTSITSTGLTPDKLSGPKGVAVDSTGSVYISDTGNNRILKMDASSGAFSVLGNYVWISGSLCDGGSTTAPCPAVGLKNEPGALVSATTPPPQYAFKAPQGLAVDAFNNVYVADTGNSAVVEIPSNIALGGAVPLLNYPGAPKFSTPVAIAIDSQNNIWVADNKLQGQVIVELPPGGGDLVTVPGAQFPNTKAAGLSTPNGIAVDAAGNVYVSDSGTNTVVELPSGSGQGNTPFALNFIGLSTPAGLALDANGNLYVADSGNKQVLLDFRQSPVINFGTVPQGKTAQPLCSGTVLSDGFNNGTNTTPCVLTVTNIGSQPITLTAPITTLSGAANAAFNSPVPDSCASITGGGPLPVGISCTISPTFTPTANSGQTETLNINGGPQSIALTANGAQPQVNIVLTSSLGTSPAAGTTTTITATVTQPHIAGNTPSGTVTFSYVIDAANNNANSCGTPGTQTVALSGGVATFQLPTLAQGVQYTVSANYNGDGLNSQTPATPLLIAVPGVSPLAVTVTSTPAQLTFLYGGAPPAIAGTVTPNPTSPVTFAFGSAAKATTAIGTYPVVVSFSGAGSCAYGFPPALFSNGNPAVVTENPAPLTYTIPNFSALYGAPNISYGANATVTGAVNGDTVSSFTVGFAPPQSSVLAVGTYSVVPTLSGGDTGDYTITAKPATLTVTKAPVSVSISAAKTQVANTAAGVASATYGISVSTAVTQGKGVPSGTVTVSDVFTPITTTGLGTVQAPVTTSVALVAGFGTYTPTNIATGMHQYSFTYNGDSNFQTATIAPSPTAAACTPSTPSTNCLVVDTADFTLTSNTGPVIIIPGIVPSGNGLLAAPNQSTSAPETAVLFVNGILSFAGQINLFCTPQSPAYVSCFMLPTSVTIAASGTGVTAASVIGISTPATEPLGFNFGTTTGQLRTTATRTVLAFLPFGALAFCVRRRRRLSKALWMLMLVCAVGAGMSGCGGNQVAFYSPIPTGPQIVTVTACTASTLSACQASSFTGLSRTFVVPISID